MCVGLAVFKITIEPRCERVLAVATVCYKE